MAITTQTNLATTTYKDRVLNASAETISAGAITLMGMRLNNSANSAASYFKAWDASPTVGTTAPTYVHRVPAATIAEISFGENGKAFGALYIAGVTTGGKAGAVSPTSDFIADLYAA